MSAYVLSADAERDLDHIWDFIAEDSVDMADRWIGGNRGNANLSC